MLRRATVVVGICLFVLAGAVAAGADVHYKSKITLKDPEQVMKQAKRGTFRYRGRVTGEVPACSKQRLVTLYLKQPSKPAAEVGNTETDPNGRWAIELNVNMAGKYYAVASKRSFGPSDSKTCLSATSDKVSFPPG